MLSHDLAHELLNLPNAEVSYADGDDLLDIDGAEVEDGEIVLSCDDEEDGPDDEQPAIDVPFKVLA